MAFTGVLAKRFDACEATLNPRKVKAGIWPL